MKRQSSMRASLGNACRGVRYMAMERNFRIELCAGGGAVLLGIATALTPMQWCTLLLVIGIVLLCEGLNTAVEYAVDSVVRERNRLAGIAKDVSAGASLIAVVMAACVGCLLFWRPQLLSLARQPLAWISACAYAAVSIAYITKAKGREN